MDNEKTAKLGATVKANLTTEITTDDYTTRINEAVAAIATALAGVTTLDEPAPREDQDRHHQRDRA